jgi:hypothetical protein
LTWREGEGCLRTGCWGGYWCSALNDNKINHRKIVKFIEEIDTLANTGPHKVPYVLTRSQYEHH